MSFSNLNNNLHNNNNNSQDYGIPVAPPHIRDIEMTDSDTTTAHEHYALEKSRGRGGKLNKSRSPGKRVVYYHSLEPEHIWSQQQQQKIIKRIGNKNKLFHIKQT